MVSGISILWVNEHIMYLYHWLCQEYFLRFLLTSIFHFTVSLIVLGKWEKFPLYYMNQLSLPWVSYIVMMFWDIEVPSSKSLPPWKQDPIFDLHRVLNRPSSSFSLNFLVHPYLCIAYVPLPSSIFKCVNGHPPLQARGKKVKFQGSAKIENAK